MISSKKIDRIVAAIMIAALIVCISAMAIKPDNTGGKNDGPAAVKRKMEYEQKLFNTSTPITIDISIDSEKWSEMMDNAYNKKWQSCDITVNGTRFYNVGIRTKGDSSLSSVAEDPNSMRYSFKLKFNKYEDGQKCWGLDKLCLNNNYGDITNMKEAMVYDMFHYLDADAPLYNYAKINVNGEYWGVYLALEAVDESFLQRTYGNQKGALYKPGNADAQDGSEEGDWSEDEMLSEVMEMMEEGGEDDWQEGVNEGGAELKYIDDDLSSYWGIWPSQINKTTEEAHKRVVRALKSIGEKKDLESYIDMDNVLRYMAAHQFSVNNDSLSGDGAHNYYLYETDGRLNLIPWDYNLCFGAYDIELGMGEDPVTEQTATDVVNMPIDDKWAHTTFFDGILENDTYREIYHSNYRKLAEGYVLGGGFDLFYSRTRSAIDDLVRTDPNAFYTYDKYDKAAKMLKQTVMMRGQSVKGQLDGSIPSTVEEQKKHPEKLIDAGMIDLKTMGGDSINEDMNGEDPDGSGWEEDMSDEDWQNIIKEYMEQQKAERHKTILLNTAKYLSCLLVMITASLIVCLYHRKRI